MTDLSDVTRIPLAVAAYAAAVKPDTIRKWVRRGNISPPVDGLYNAAEIVDWIETVRDQHRAKIAENRYRVDVSRRHGFDLAC